MREIICPGLPADWVNAWLAAVGATRVQPELRLRWTSEPLPRAVLCADAMDPVALLAAAWPTPADLRQLPIAETWGDTPPVKRKVPLSDYRERVRSARSDASSWALSSTMTDLHVTQDGEIAHAPFDPAAPGPTGGLHQRLTQVHGKVDPTVARLARSLDGTADRVPVNGLGFDITRLAARAADKTKSNAVDPVIEVLAFFGLALLPVRGRGTDARIDKSIRPSVRQRGWMRPPDNGHELRFYWPAWKQPLGFDGIDALLDVWQWANRSDWSALGVHSAWRTVAYQRRSTGDPTRGFGSERLWPTAS